MLSWVALAFSNPRNDDSAWIALVIIIPQMAFIGFDKICGNFVDFKIDCVAGREGFEPPEVLPSTVFKTAAFNHSAISRT